MRRKMLPEFPSYWKAAELGHSIAPGLRRPASQLWLCHRAGWLGSGPHIRQEPTVLWDCSCLGPKTEARKLEFINMHVTGNALELHAKNCMLSSNSSPLGSSLTEWKEKSQMLGLPRLIISAVAQHSLSQILKVSVSRTVTKTQMSPQIFNITSHWEMQKPKWPWGKTRRKLKINWPSPPSWLVTTLQTQSNAGRTEQGKWQAQEERQRKKKQG